MSSRSTTDCEGFHRRDFIKIGAAGLFGLTLPQLLRLESQANASEAAGGPKRRADAVIMLWLGGGPATIDMWDLKPNAPTEIRGEFKPITTNVPGLQICEHLPKTAKVCDQLTIVRSLNHSIPAHGPATVFMQTGNKPTPALQYPVLGSLTTRLMSQEKGVPPFVSFGESRNGSAAGYLGTAYNPFVIEGDGGKGGKGGKATFRVRGIQLPTGFTLDELENRNKLLNDFDGAFRANRQIRRSGGRPRRVSQEGPGNPAFRQDEEGVRPRAREARAARRLRPQRFRPGRVGGAAAGRGRCAFRDHQPGRLGHARQELRDAFQARLPQLDQTLSALVQDLSDRGMLDRTLVYCAGEFGRTPKINKNAGRDHWARSMSVVLAGGGIKRGYAHGATDAHGMAPATEPCTPDDVSSTIFHCLGIDPHTELQTSTGRPISCSARAESSRSCWRKPGGRNPFSRDPTGERFNSSTPCRVAAKRRHSRTFPFDSSMASWDFLSFRSPGG